MKTTITTDSGAKALDWGFAKQLVAAGIEAGLSDPMVMLAIARAEGGQVGSELGYGIHQQQEALGKHRGTYRKAGKDEKADAEGYALDSKGQRMFWAPVNTITPDEVNQNFMPHWGMAAQMKGLATQLKLSEQRYEADRQKHPGYLPTMKAPDGRYSEEFLRYHSWGGQTFGIENPSYRGYAPLNASDTDPKRLNDNHYVNTSKYYKDIPQNYFGKYALR